MRVSVVELRYALWSNKEIHIISLLFGFLQTQEVWLTCYFSSRVGWDLWPFLSVFKTLCTGSWLETKYRRIQSYVYLYIIFLSLAANEQLFLPPNFLCDVITIPVNYGWTFGVLVRILDYISTPLKDFRKSLYLPCANLEPLIGKALYFSKKKVYVEITPCGNSRESLFFFSEPRSFCFFVYVSPRGHSCT